MSAVEAAVAVADAYGVHCEDPVVLREAWHVLVHLRPWPVVARVTSGAPGVDPADVERELTVAWHAARAGAPVVPPSDLLPPGPHRHDGHTVVFWRYLVQAGRLDATAAGRGLRTIHDSLADYDGELPRAGRAEEVRAMLRAFAPSDDAEILCELASRELPDGQALHGDAHLFNCIQTTAGPIWHDLETACRGPVNTTSPPSYWKTARTGQIPKPGVPSPHMEASTRSSSIRHSRSTPPGSQLRSWLRSLAAQTPRPPSTGSCGSCDASAARPALHSLDGRAATRQEAAAANTIRDLAFVF
jgi:hypothetical protein